MSVTALHLCINFFISNNDCSLLQLLKTSFVKSLSILLHFKTFCKLIFVYVFLQMYAYYVLRGDMLSHLEVHLKDAVVKMQSNPTDWRYLEAVLHAYSSVAETVAETDNFYVPRFIQSIPQIPFSDNIQLISVALTTLGEILLSVVQFCFVFILYLFV